MSMKKDGWSFGVWSFGGRLEFWSSVRVSGSMILVKLSGMDMLFYVMDL